MSPDLVIVTTAVLVAVPCALLGTFLVLRQMSMLGDAISHAVLPGIVFAFFLSETTGPLTSLVGAGLFGVLAAVLIEALKDTGRVAEDSSIGIVFTALFALGVFLISRFASGVHLDLQHVLYGEIAFSPLNPLVVGGAALGPRSFWTLGIVTAIALGLVGLLYKELKLATFDAGLAAAVGLSPALVHHLLVGAVSVTTVGAFDSVGAILVVAFLVVPPATAYLLAERLSRVMALSVLFGVLSALAGYWLASLFDVAISGMMAVAAGGFFLIALLLSPSHGLVAVILRRRTARRVFSRTLLLSRLEGLGGRATRGELADALGWDGAALTRAVEDASRGGQLSSPAPGELALTDRGREENDRIPGRAAAT